MPSRMLVASLAGIGLFVGITLDALIVRLAVPRIDGDDETVEHRNSGAPAPVFAAERGSLVVASKGVHWRRRLAVMAATAVLFALAAMRFDELAHVAIVATYASVLIVCAGTDLLSFRVPNVITYPAIAGAIVIGALLPDTNMWEVLAGGGLAGGILLVPSLLTGGMGMGMGDVKLAAFVGLAIGFTNAAPAMLIMALGGGAVAAFLLATGRRSKGEPIPYAPFISTGGLVVLLWQGAAFTHL